MAREFRIRVREDGIQFKAFLHDDGMLEIVDDSTYSIERRIEMMNHIKTVTNCMRARNLESFKIDRDVT